MINPLFHTVRVRTEGDQPLRALALGAMVMSARVLAGLSLHEGARRLGLPPKVLSDVENGRVRFVGDDACALKAAEYARSLLLCDVDI